MEFTDFIAGNNAEAVVQFRPSPEAQQRFEDLVEMKKSGEISVQESTELDHLFELEHIMRMAKARARMLLLSGQ